MQWCTKEKVTKLRTISTKFHFQPFDLSLIDFPIWPATEWVFPFCDFHISLSLYISYCIIKKLVRIKNLKSVVFFKMYLNESRTFQKHFLHKGWFLFYDSYDDNSYDDKVFGLENIRKWNNFFLLLSSNKSILICFTVHHGGSLVQNLPYFLIFLLKILISNYE